MATATQTSLPVDPREPSGSRSARRLRREAKVPGVVYGAGQDPVPFAVDARELRHALADAGAVLSLDVGGSRPTPVVVKELTRHAVNGEIVHIDLLRVRMDEAIQSTVILELIGAEDAPGVREGGVLEQVARELSIQALPGDIPDSVAHDVSGLQIGENVTVAELTAPDGVTFLDDPDTTVATVTPPRLQASSDTEIEEEVELVAQGSTSDEAEQAAAQQAEQAGEDQPAG